jgi:hypothetical protein
VPTHCFVTTVFRAGLAVAPRAEVSSTVDESGRGRSSGIPLGVGGALGSVPLETETIMDKRVKQVTVLRGWRW